MTDPTTDTAMRDLVVENELLTNEVRRLRSRIAALEEELAVAPPAPQANEALGDLRYLLGKLDSSPAGPLLRRQKGFRNLRERYLGD